MTEVKDFIPVAEPALIGNEREYVLDCIDSSWISSAGHYVERFESEFAKFCGVRHAMACSNGTVALHLALLALEIRPGDEVIVPAMTFVATANAVSYCGAKPVFADSDRFTWNLDPAHVASLVTARTRAIIAVHLFGLPADMDELQAIADKHNIVIIEDAAEAHGAQYRGKPVGSLSTLATFSFYGNKILTTGEGGMVTTDDDHLAERIRLLKGQGLSPDRRYWHPVVGYNYRLTNVAAAIGVAQLEKVDWHLSRRAEIASRYRDMLGGFSDIRLQATPSDRVHTFWMNSIVLEGADAKLRDAVMRYLFERKIESRPFFVPMHLLPIYARNNYLTLPVAEELGVAGISLPSGARLSEADQYRVVECLINALRESR